MPDTYKRRLFNINFSIKRSMQLRLLLRIMIIVFVSVGMSGALFFIYSNRKIDQSLKQFHIQAHFFLDFLLPFIIISLALGILIALAFALFFPHKIAGPLYRIEKNLREQVGNGNLRCRFGVRTGDELAELADTLNVTMGQLRVKLLEVKDTAEELTVCLNAISSEDGAIKEALEKSRRLNEVMKSFKL